MDDEAQSGAEAAPGRLVERLRLTPRDHRPGLLSAALREQIARLLCLDLSDIDVRRPLLTLGMSSLQAVEMKTYWERVLGLPLRATLLFDYPALDTLVPYLLARLSSTGSAPAEATRAAGAGNQPEPLGSSAAVLPNPTTRTVAQALAAELADLRGEGVS